MDKGGLTPLERSWVMYDVGNSAFVLLAATLIPICFNDVAAQAGVSSAQYLAFWGYANAIVTAIVAVAGPILGTLADTDGFKKRIFQASVLLGVIGCGVLGFMRSWRLFLMVFILAKCGYAASLVFYDSMLSDVTTEKRMDDVSARGYAWGYLGSCVPFVAGLFIVLGANRLRLATPTAMALAFLLSAVWWLCATLPLLRRYRQLHFVARPAHVVSGSLSRIAGTLKGLKNDRKVLLFLLAFFCYIDGVYTIIDMATAYGTALKLETTGLLLALLLMQIVAFPSSLIFGRLSARYTAERLIPVCILGYVGIAGFAFFLTEQWQFWVLAICVGLVQGGIQALSRSHFTRIIPAEKSGEYFGLFDICGKGASFLGTMLVSVTSQITGNASFGVGSLTLLFIVGFFLFRASCREKPAG